MTQAPSRTAAIRALARQDSPAAEAALTALLADLFAIAPQGLRINHDQYSLNSLNGFFEAAGEGFFFKFHQEEGEAEMAGEYYRADILARAGLPVDLPLWSSTQPGEQILVYRRRAEPRFSDVLRGLDLAPDALAAGRALAAQAALEDHLLAVARTSLAPITPAQSAAEPIHRLFHQRLVDPASGHWPGGRFAAFYQGQSFALPGCTLDWQAFSTARPVLNGVEYRDDVGTLFARAAARLHPARLADAGGIVAHGDAHNANVWYERGAVADRLVFFDPAFAGAAVPSLLAEVKATFHNHLAHPFWLYDPGLACDHFRVTARHDGVRLYLETDWQPNALRQDLLAVKAAHYWKPWLATLAGAGMLPGDWEDVLRLALFLCPTLVMNLRAGAGGHSPQSSAIGFAMAIMAGSPPVAGQDLMTRFFDSIRPA
ncbi:hypothetical protein [Rhodobacter ferrooxidans]|uniref:Aminoglycoside phosphotransferase domain-containing protein n=1 Tax=Rhodobacter ferrooxidans TaxID=371731 RepID=C8RZG7_9RHOB|nr:hypothetical protein [Rhodobacter sp. SW2]EEW25764.1 conserved hypothetical protein [Rhodobacter sp. SW2]